MNKFKVDILAFGAHPDDVECAIGGTILGQIKKGHTVAIVDLTMGELGSSGSVKIRAAETGSASKMLGISFRENLKMKDGFIDNSLPNKLDIIKMIRKYQPKIVLATAIHDRHPDHSYTAKLIIEATFLSGLKKIKTNYNNFIQKPHRPVATYNYIQDLYIVPDFVIDISNTFEYKLQVIKAYKSQFLNASNNQPNGPNALLKQVEATNSIFGRAINTKYAEGFTTTRYLGTDDIMNLI